MKPAPALVAMVAIALSMSATPSSSDGITSTLNAACGALAPTIEACFAPVLPLGDVLLPTQSPPPPPGGLLLGYVGAVRLVLVEDVLELPSASFDASGDLCAPYAPLMIPCEVILSQPVVVPEPNVPPPPSSIYLATAYVGTLTLRQGGETVAVLPAYVELVGCAPAGPHSFGFDIDCDSFSNADELAADSNPFYKYSTPGDNGSGFSNVNPCASDWDADNWATCDEIHPLTNYQNSDPFQRCSTPFNPNGWSFTNPTHKCEA